jgi:hypothetical protein
MEIKLSRGFICLTATGRPLYMPYANVSGVQVFSPGRHTRNTCANAPSATGTRSVISSYSMRHRSFSSRWRNCAGVRTPHSSSARYLCGAINRGIVAKVAFASKHPRGRIRARAAAPAKSSSCQTGAVTSSCQQLPTWYQATRPPCTLQVPGWRASSPCRRKCPDRPDPPRKVASSATSPLDCE